MNKINKALAVIVPFAIFNSPTIIANAQENQALNISEVNRTANQVSLSIDNTNISKIRLPNGNWVSSSYTKYTVMKNGNYEFIGITKSGSYVTGSYTVKGLKDDLLITGSKNVKLKLNSKDSLSGVSKMQLKNEDTSWSEKKDYSPNLDWVLSDGDGIKTVYAKFTDLAGNETSNVFDNIYLDTTAPVISNLQIQFGREYFNSKDVVLSVDVADNRAGTDYLLISNNQKDWRKIEWEDVKNKPISWDLIYGMDASWGTTPGLKNVYVKAVDNIGNISNVVSDDIYLDINPPKGNVSINHGATYVGSKDVTLTLNYSDMESGVSKVEILDEGKTYTVPDISKPTQDIPWTLSKGNNASVKIRITDKAGNVSIYQSNVVSVSSLDITQFRLINIVNPSVGSFTPLIWDFPPQLMLSSANVSFDINYNMVIDSTMTAVVNGDYIVEIVGDDGYYKKIQSKYDDTIKNGFKATFTIPSDAPKGSKVYISSKLTSTIHCNDSEVITRDAYFPAINEKALIGTVDRNINNDIIFNQTT